MTPCLPSFFPPGWGPRRPTWTIREEKLVNFNRLTALQDAISEEKHRAYVGRTVRCLLDGLSDDERYDLTARTPGNRLVRVVGGRSALGQFRDVKITDANKWSLFGELIE